MVPPDRVDDEHQKDAGKAPARRAPDRFDGQRDDDGADGGRFGTEHEQIFLQGRIADRQIGAGAQPQHRQHHIVERHRRLGRRASQRRFDEYDRHGDAERECHALLGKDLPPHIEVDLGGEKNRDEGE